MSIIEKFKRQENITAHYENCLYAEVIKLLAILEPMKQIQHGELNYINLIGYAASKLAEEYQEVSGHPVMDILKEQAKEKVQVEAESLPL